jgi:hypothetical protein
MTPKEVHGIIRLCPYCKVLQKVYKDIGGGRGEENFYGFLCSVNSNLGKSYKLELVREFCQHNKLPVTIEDIQESLTKFNLAWRITE